MQKKELVAGAGGCVPRGPGVGGGTFWVLVEQIKESQKKKKEKKKIFENRTRQRTTERVTIRGAVMLSGPSSSGPKTKRSVCKGQGKADRQGSSRGSPVNLGRLMPNRSLANSGNHACLENCLGTGDEE